MFKPDSVLNVAMTCELCDRHKYFTLDGINSALQWRTVPDFVKSLSDSTCYRDESISYMSSGGSSLPYRDFLSGGYGRMSYSWHTARPFSRAKLEKIKTQFPDFTFLLFCGRGRFGEVWLVQDLSEQVVALKMIPKTAFSQLQTEKGGLIVYRNKIRNFEHLVQIYHVGQTEDFFYYTMEAAYSISKDYYIPVTLARLLEHCSFSPADSADISLNILEGLEILHSNGLAHRDIKPENIVFVDGRVKVCDFSLISNKDKKSYAGTEFFIPQDIDDIPVEQFGVNCDLFAAGKVLYSVLANEKDIAEFPKIDRSILKDNLAKNLNLILNKACDPAYKNRFSSAYDFMQAMSRIYAHA